MQAMILAAGRGERMRPLTDSLPKPLIPVAGKPLIVWHLEKLAQAGINDVVINHAWLGKRLEEYLGTGSAWGVNIQYSPETTALETAGGIATALPLLGQNPFLVVNGDVWCDWDFRLAPAIATRLTTEEKLAWLLLAQNPEHHPSGDFGLSADELVSEHGAPKLTFAGIGLYQPKLFAHTPAGQPAKLAPLLRAAMTQQKVLGARHSGRWVDVGTPERLSELNHQLGHV
jgi:MurNAc alpha-1-phosphate uridylyltransferase